MAKLSLEIIRAVKRSKLSQAAIAAAIDAASEPKEPPARKRRIYNRRDMEAEA